MWLIRKFKELYNQNLDEFTRNWCSVYTLMYILRIQWGLVVDNKYIIEVLKQAERDKVWGETWWAYFRIIYNWFTGWFYKQFNTTIEVKAFDVNSNDFEKLLREWYAFGLWLLYAWRWYKNARADWDISMDEILEFKKDENSIYWHNHVYMYSPVKNKFYIIETLWSAKDKTIEMSIEELRAAVKKWIYYPTARTLVMKDRLLKKYLKMYQNNESIDDITKLPKEDFEALQKASKMRTFLKI